MTTLVLAALLAQGTAGQLAATQAAEVIAEIRVHGNHVTPNTEIIALAGISVGDPVTADTLPQAQAQLERSGKFDDVEVLKRFASITDLSKVAVVIIVNEGPVRLTFETGPDGEDIAVIRRRRGFRNLMYLPILDGEDGYGLTYGVVASLAGVAGGHSRLSMPLSWGGTRRGGLELEKNFTSGPVTRVTVGGAVQRRTNPAFDEDDDRIRVWARAERAFRSLRFGVTARWEDVTFGPLSNELRGIGADVTLDTRVNPAYPRNAILATAELERVSFTSGATLYRTRFDGRGYLGLFGQTVLGVRVLREGANGPQPAYFRPLLGGWSNLRGFEAGAFTGDILLAGSAEVFVPLTRPLSAGLFGVSAFVDTGVAYDDGQRLKDQTRRTGIGGSIWMTATVFRISLSVAHGRHAGTRINFGLGLTFK
jgi:outer membrane protein assembly factor BamA